MLFYNVHATTAWCHSLVRGRHRTIQHFEFRSVVCLTRCFCETEKSNALLNSSLLWCKTHSEEHDIHKYYSHCLAADLYLCALVFCGCFTYLVCISCIYREATPSHRLILNVMNTGFWFYVQVIVSSSHSRHIYHSSCHWGHYGHCGRKSLHLALSHRLLYHLSVS